MDDWENFGEASLPEKEEFYSYLNMEDIIDEDYGHAKRVSKDFEIKKIQESTMTRNISLYLLICNNKYIKISKLKNRCFFNIGM